MQYNRISTSFHKVGCLGLFHFVHPPMLEQKSPGRHNIRSAPRIHKEQLCFFFFLSSFCSITKYIGVSCETSTLFLLFPETQPPSFQLIQPHTLGERGGSEGGCGQGEGVFFSTCIKSFFLGVGLILSSCHCQISWVKDLLQVLLVIYTYNLN